MIDIDADEPIQLDDGHSYHFVQQVGPIVRLARIPSRERVDMHIAELGQRLVGLPPNLTPALSILNAMPKVLQEKTMQMAEHVEELLTGLRPGHDKPLPEYDPKTTSLNQRIATKVTELNAVGITASRSTLNRRIRAYRDQGAAGLVDNRLIRADGPLARLDPIIHTILCEVMADQMKRSTGTLSRIIVEARGAALKQHGLTADDLPSDASFYRYIEVLDNRKLMTATAKKRQSESEKPNRTATPRVEVLPGAEMQIDTNTVDVLVRGPSGTVLRPMLTIMLDRATHSIVAHTVRLKATKGVDHAVLLAQAFTPPQNRPDRTHFRTAIQNANPHIGLLEPQRRRQLELSRPFIRPEVIMMDNGRDFAGNTFIAAAEQLRVSIRLAAPHTPLDKSAVERTFRSLQTLFFQFLPGYVGRSPDHRAQNVEKENLMDIYAFQELLDDWILENWGNRKNKSLKDRIFPGTLLTPNQKYSLAARVTDSIRTPLSTDQYIALMPSHFRIVSAIGVQIDGRQFDSAELHRFRHEKSTNQAKKGQWEFKLDPYNPHVAWMRSPDDTWITCPLRSDEQDFYPHQDAYPLNQDEQDRNAVVAVSNAVAGNYSYTPAETSDPFNFDDEPVTDFELEEFDPNKE